MVVILVLFMLKGFKCSLLSFAYILLITLSLTIPHSFSFVGQGAIPRAG